MIKYDISAIGECLIDMIPSGTNENGVELLSANPGGAPANVLAMYSKLGGKTAFIGKVGNDSFGNTLRKNLTSAGIDDCGLIADEKYNTTLAFVHHDDKGDRSFSFYRKGCADVMITPEDVNEEILKNTDIFHFGSVSLTDEPSRSATLYAVKKAKENGAIISYDPNYRPLLWDSRETAESIMKDGAGLADIIKVSDEELTLLTGEKELLKGAKKLADMGIALVFVTLGADGAFYYNKNGNGLLKTFDVKTVDTTGAGDSFFGSVLWILKGKTVEEISNLSKAELDSITNFGNAAGSLATTRKGAIPAMPNFEEITLLLGTESENKKMSTVKQSYIIADMHTHSEHSHDSLCPINNMREINPDKTTRATAFELWMKAPNPMVTFFKTYDVMPLIKASKARGMKFNMLLDFCIGKAAASVKEFYLLPIGEKLYEFDKIAVNTIVANKDGEVSSCDIAYTDNLEQFNADYLKYTKEVHDTCSDRDLSENHMVIGTSAIVDTELDGAVGMNSGIFNNPFMIWSKYRIDGEKALLPISFQFHHTQMDGAHAGRFLKNLQDEIENMK